MPAEFILIATRAEDAAADEEYASFLRFTGLPEHRLRRIRLEQGPLPDLNLDRIAGVIVGGSPFTSTDPVEAKSPVQLRVESELAGLVGEVVRRDLPFFGACYGVGTVGLQIGGLVDRTYSEPISAVTVSLTAEGMADPLLEGMPPVFEAFVGHKEALRHTPPDATLLATSPACPVQMFRHGRNVYATQFHPELDLPGILTRIRVYSDYGYFHPHDAQTVTAQVSASSVTDTWRVLRAFAEQYG